MTQISFARRKYIDDMVEGTKTTTIRRNWERWVKELKAQHDLHVYYGSWRSAYRVYVGKCKLVSVKVLRGSQLTYEDALADGFEHLVALYDALRVLNDMPLEAVLEHKWAILEMGAWLHGPYWAGEQEAIES